MDTCRLRRLSWSARWSARRRSACSDTSGGRSSTITERGSSSPSTGTSSGPGAAASIARGAVDPALGGGEHGERHRAQVAQRLVAVLAGAELDLGHRVEPDLAVDVDQHRDLDAVADREREPLEQLAARGDLAGQRLQEAGQVGDVEVEQRAGDQLGDAAAAVGDDGVADPQRPPEGALDERGAGVGRAAGRAGR